MSSLAFANTKSVVSALAVPPPWIKLLGGGFRAAQCEISGNQSSNRTALTVSILLQAFDAGECCAGIDAGGTFDPESAAEAGLYFEQLLWVDGLRLFIPLIDATSPSSVTYLREL